MAGQKRFGVCSGPVAGPPNFCCMSSLVSGGPCRGLRLTCARGDPMTPWQAFMSCTAVIRADLLESQAFSALCLSRCPVSDAALSTETVVGHVSFPSALGLAFCYCACFTVLAYFFNCTVSSANLLVFCHKVRRLVLFCCCFK